MFRRRTTPESAEVPVGEPAVEPGAPSKKGRPTPKRREAVQARKQRVRPVANRREAMRRDRERTRQQRLKARQAMNTGDERYFLPRDQGPVRGFLRDYIDSRRTIAEFFLPIVLVVLLTSLIGIPAVQMISTLLWVVVMILLIIDLIILGRRIRREIRKRFPDDTGKGHVLYAITRATQIRRFRMPKPTVKPGALV